jgi:hypothetical protein
MAGLRRLGYPFLDQLPSIDHILAPGKLRYQLLEWLFLQYVQSLQPIYNTHHLQSKSPKAFEQQVRRQPADCRATQRVQARHSA